MGSWSDRRIRGGRNGKTFARTAARHSRLAALRCYTTMTEYRDSEYHKGPIGEYDARVKAGTLRNDDHQRSMQTHPGLSYAHS